MSEHGYYRYPTISGDVIAFVSEDDLWVVPESGGVARRLTAGRGDASRPAFSPDGRWLAYTGREEGPPEAFVMPAEGGPSRRLSYFGTPITWVAGWTPAGEVLVATSAHQAHLGFVHLHALPVAGGLPRLLPVGPAFSMSWAADGRRSVLGRNTNDLARWKRYRGGRAGDLWVDARGRGEFRRLLTLPGNLATPVWVGARIYFLSDHEGIGNIYSVTPAGADLRRHTHHETYYARSLSTDGRRIVYHAGADLWCFDPAQDAARPVAVEYRSPRVQRNRRFVSPWRYLSDYHPRPDGKALAVVARGRSLVFDNWDGPVRQPGAQRAGRHRLTRFLHDGRRVVTVSDSGDEEFLEVHPLDGGAPRALTHRLLGRPVELEPSPVADLVALANQRFELLLADAARRTVRRLDVSAHDPIGDLAWSPDGRWLAYRCAVGRACSIIKIADVHRGAIHEVTRPEFRDYGPAWDPQGRYLYFLSFRGFDPVYDMQYFDLGFPRATRPMLATLQTGTPSPFLPLPQPAADGKPEPGAKAPAAQGKGARRKPAPVRIDFAGLADRVLAFEVPDGRYREIAGAPGKALFTSFPIPGALDTGFLDEEDHDGGGRLMVWNFEERRAETLVRGVLDLRVTPDGKTLVYRTGAGLRVVGTAEKPSDAGADGGATKKTGWIDGQRPRLAVDPPAEWRQMYTEAWRLQRDHFWVPDMSRVDWKEVYRRYRPLLDRVGTRGEFSDLMWEMQGELGTSHAYEFGGDYRPHPSYPRGFLGADFRWDARARGYRIVRLLTGESWAAGSPLAAPGVGLRAGDVVTALAGHALRADLPPGEALLNMAGHLVEVAYKVRGRGPVRRALVRTLAGEFPLRYRAWVAANRAFVHRRSRGAVGYLHVPDMGPKGYAEFHRAYLLEAERQALIVDVRFNAGGHVSQLILEKLARRRLGYDLRRYGRPEPFPAHSVGGPMVAITNEAAGSDGDIFSHCFKLMQLGPLIGKRTWGGVIGIHPRHRLVDGSLTTQPEFSFWFSDVHWGVENYGTDPDLEVDVRPQDYAAGRDPQLERALREVQALRRTRAPLVPDFSRRPNLALPVLPRVPRNADGVAAARRARRASAAGTVRARAAARGRAPRDA